MPQIINASDIASLLVADTPLLDLRAPLEFQRGAFGNAVNLPLLDDDERAAIGKIYKSTGQQAAIDLGNQLISGPIKEQRLQQWRDFIQLHPDSVLYCFRGGLRSQTVQTWLEESGIAVPRIDGGYKRMRRLLLTTIEQSGAESEFLIVAGKTGSGKTHLINQLPNSIDLEGLANHRGSAFGRRIQQQPSQIDFENNLAIALLKLPFNSGKRIFLEDESRAIGSLSIPIEFHNGMRAAPIAVLEVGIEQRVSTILNDYIISNYLDFKTDDPDNYKQLFADYLLGSLGRIKRRLGAEGYQQVLDRVHFALSQPQDKLDAHRDWIRQLLETYYDPMYEYQLGKKSSRIVFRGNREEFLRWAAHLHKPAKVLNA